MWSGCPLTSGCSKECSSHHTLRQDNLHPGPEVPAQLEKLKLELPGLGSKSTAPLSEAESPHPPTVQGLARQAWEKSERLMVSVHVSPYQE